MAARLRALISPPRACRQARIWPRMLWSSSRRRSTPCRATRSRCGEWRGRTGRSGRRQFRSWKAPRVRPTIAQLRLSCSASSTRLRQMMAANLRRSGPARPARRPCRAARRRRRPPPTPACPAPAARPISPASTSPAPAVASHGGALSLIAARPSGAAMTVSAPLSSTTPPSRARRAPRGAELVVADAGRTGARTRPRAASARRSPRSASGVAGEGAERVGVGHHVAPGGRPAAAAARARRVRAQARARRPRPGAARPRSSAGDAGSLTITPGSPAR